MLSGWLTKAVIVLVVFPVIGHLIYSVVIWFFTRALLPVLSVAEGWSVTLERTILGATILGAALGSFSICRRLWPSEPVKINQ